MFQRTDRLQIRKFQAQDIDGLHRLLSDMEVMQYIEPPYSREKTAAFLKQAGLCEPPLIFAVENREGAFVGYVIYHPYDESAYELGWVLHKAYWHQGYAQELTEALIEDARCRADSLIIECAPQQSATKKIALRNGFVYEGNPDGCDVYRLRLHHD